MNDEQQPEAGDRRRQIMAAALEVFSSKGFEKATNKDIAEAAGGISPGLIYHYFKDKQDLFFSILHERAPIVSLAAHPERLMDLPPREGLTLIAHSYMQVARIPGNSAVIRLLVSEALRFPQVADMLAQRVVSRILSVVTRYLQLQIDKGLLRVHDPAIAARSFVGMLVVHIATRELLRLPEVIATADDTITETVVAIFLQGLEREPG